MPRGGARAGSGRKSLGETKPLSLVLDSGFYALMDQARRCVPPSGVTRAEFLRRALSSYLLQLASGCAFEPAPPGKGTRSGYLLKLRGTMRREAEAAASAAGVSLAELVRSAGIRLVRETP